jgi:hypothetical protein
LCNTGATNKENKSELLDRIAKEIFGGLVGL